jgi:hypothetical protein
VEAFLPQALQHSDKFMSFFIPAILKLDAGAFPRLERR